jgi:hypothetical protein
MRFSRIVDRLEKRRVSNAMIRKTRWYRFFYMQHSRLEKSVAWRFIFFIYAFIRLEELDFVELLVWLSFFCFNSFVSEYDRRWLQRRRYQTHFKEINIFHLYMHAIVASSSSSRVVVELKTKPDVGVPTQPIDGVEHPTLFNELGWVDESVRRPNPIHSRDAHPLFEKKKVWNNLLIWWFYDQKIKKNIFLKKNFSKKSKKSRRYT